MLMESDRGNVHLAPPDGGQTNLESTIDNHDSAQTTLAIGEGGLPCMHQSGAVPRWFTFQPALVPQPIEPEVRHLSHVVGVR